MPNEEDYKMAYETLSRAIEETVQILAAARLRVIAGLHMEEGKDLGELDKDILALINQLDGKK